MEGLQAAGKCTEQVDLSAPYGLDWKGEEEGRKLLRKERQRSRNELAFSLVPTYTPLTSSFQLLTLLLC